MAGTILLVIGIAALFYAALPALGAVLARERWRRFRATVTSVSLYPTAGPDAIRQRRATGERGEPAGLYRFFGTLEAIQGEDRIWLTNGRFSVAAELRRVRVYLIPEMERTETDPLLHPGASPSALGSVPWSRIFSLPEGTPVFVGGALFAEDGRGVFRDSPRSRLLVVIHDCPRENVVLHAISGGRQRNEYINTLTLPSVAIGSLSLVLLALSHLTAPERTVALLALTAGCAPLVPFLPPGVPLYFAYRAAWKKARRLRVQRDIVRLPLRYFPPLTGSPPRRATLLPDLEPYAMVIGRGDPADTGVLLSAGERIRLPPGITRVDVRLPGTARQRSRRSDGSEGDPRAASAGSRREEVAFCGYTVLGDEVALGRTEDPMADHMVLPGLPEVLGRDSERAARRSALVSVVLIGLDVAINLPLVFLLLSAALR